MAQTREELAVELADAIERWSKARLMLQQLQTINRQKEAVLEQQMATADAKVQRLRLRYEAK